MLKPPWIQSQTNDWYRLILVTNHCKFHLLIFSRAFSGFATNSPPDTVVICVFDFILDELVNKRECCRAVLVDIKIAFDTVDHQILLRNKIERYIFWPFLFILYINNIFDCINPSKMFCHLYADDTIINHSPIPLIKVRRSEFLVLQASSQLILIKQRLFPWKKGSEISRLTSATNWKFWPVVGIDGVLFWPLLDPYGKASGVRPQSANHKKSPRNNGEQWKPAWILARGFNESK